MRDTKGRELSNATFIKTALMLMVVFYHCILFWKGNWFTQNPALPAAPLGVLADWFNSFHVQGFTLVSGYLFYYAKYERGKYCCFMPFAANKAKRLLIPYLFISLVWVIPVKTIFYEEALGSYLLDFGLAVSPNQLWFLWMLFDVFVIGWLFSGFFKKHDARGFCVAVLFWGVGVLGSSIAPNVFQIWNACQYLIYFWIGFKFRQRGSGLLRKVPLFAWPAAHAVLFAASQVIRGIIADGGGGLLSLMRTALNLPLNCLGAISAFVLLDALAKRVNVRSSPMFALLSRYSMPIYLFHQQVVYFCIWALNGRINPYLHAGINFVVAMGVSLLISAVMMRFRAARLLIGEK